jgi:hypothetical protein
LAAAKKRQERIAREKYNGWRPNYPTWNVMLWMNNEEGPYRLYRERVREYQKQKKYFNGEAAEQCCRESFGEGTPDGVMFTSGKIRWGRIAESMRAR